MGKADIIIQQSGIKKTQDKTTLASINVVSAINYPDGTPIIVLENPQHSLYILNRNSSQIDDGNLYISTNVSGVLWEKVTFSSVSTSNAPRGTYDITTNPGSYPKPNASDAVNAVQIGNGSGVGPSIKAGDYWHVINISGTDEIGPASRTISNENSVVMAIVDFAGNFDSDWIVLENSYGVDLAAGVGSLRTLGTGAQQAAAGNDSRFTNARTPLSHAASHKHGGSDEIATATSAPNEIPKANGSGKLDSWITSASEGAAGILPLASAGETLAGLDDTKAITSLKLQTKLNSLGLDGNVDGGFETSGSTIQIKRGTTSWVTTNNPVLEQGEMFVEFNNLGTAVIGIKIGDGTTAYNSLSYFASGGGGGGHVIEDEGTPLTQRTNLNFTGTGVTATDAGGKTVVNIPGYSDEAIDDRVSNLLQAGDNITLEYNDVDNTLTISALPEANGTSFQPLTSTTLSGGDNTITLAEEPVYFANVFLNNVPYHDYTWVGTTLTIPDGVDGSVVDYSYFYNIPVLIADQKVDETDWVTATYGATTNLDLGLNQYTFNQFTADTASTTLTLSNVKAGIAIVGVIQITLDGITSLTLNLPGGLYTNTNGLNTITSEVITGVDGQIIPIQWFKNGNTLFWFFPGSGGGGGGSGTVTSVTGTTNRITVGGTAEDPTIDISSSYVGQNTITTLGTVTTGVWNGTAVATTYGGTGLTTLGTANQLLRVNAGATALEYFTPTYLTANQNITLSGDVTGTGTTTITTTIANNAVTTAKIADTNVTQVKLAGLTYGTLTYGATVTYDLTGVRLSDSRQLASVSGDFTLSFTVTTANDGAAFDIYVIKSTTNPVIVTLTGSGVTHMDSEVIITTLYLPAGLVGDVLRLNGKIRVTGGLIYIDWVVRDGQIVQVLSASTTDIPSVGLVNSEFSLRHKQGGNAYGATLTIGTLDSNDIDFFRATSTAVRMSVIAAGVRVTGAGTSTGEAFLVRNSSSASRLSVLDNGNVALGGTGSFGGGIISTFFANATTSPTTNPSGGFILYGEGGIAKARRSDGTVNTIGIIPDTIEANTILGNLLGIPAAPARYPTNNLYNDAQAMFHYDLDGINEVLSSVINTLSADVTVTNTTTKTTLFAFTIPAYILRVKKEFEIELEGLISTDAVPGNLTIDSDLGATALGSSGAIAVTASQVNELVRIKFKFTCRTEGATGTVIGQGFFNDKKIIMTSTATVNTQTDLEFKVSATWDTADTDNILKITNGRVKRHF
jgi:hypothetical protein